MKMNEKENKEQPQSWFFFLKDYYNRQTTFLMKKKKCRNDNGDNCSYSRD